MFKKILYIIIVIVIIIILTIMWKGSKKEEIVPVDQTGQLQNDSPAEINKDLDSMNIDAGIDADLNAIDADLKTL